MTKAQFESLPGNKVLYIPIYDGYGAEIYKVTKSIISPDYLGLCDYFIDKTDPIWDGVESFACYKNNELDYFPIPATDICLTLSEAKKKMIEMIFREKSF